MATFPTLHPHAGSTGGLSFGFPSESLAGLLEVKLGKGWGTPYDCHPFSF